jgi:hypothetical protein
LPVMMGEHLSHFCRAIAATPFGLLRYFGVQLLAALG